MKQKLFVTSLLLIFLSLNIPAVSAKHIFTIRDTANEVTLFDSKANDILDSGAFHGEIDIVRVELVDDWIKVTLKDAPIIDIDHHYSFDIVWEYGPSTVNRSYGHIGGRGYGGSIGTNLYDSQGAVIIEGSVYDVVILNGDSIFYPICYFSLLSDPTTPELCEVSTLVYVDDPQYNEYPHLIGFSYIYYNDTLRELDITPDYPSIPITLSLVTIGGILTLLVFSPRFNKKMRK
ncbi:MAG: hypothetical protein ACTSO7_17395 [Candidatus Heimdallarchaeota archaeon]